MSAKIEITHYPVLKHGKPCKKCGHLPKKFEAPHASVCDLQWRWAGCPCRNTEPIPLGEDETLQAAWAELNA